MKVITTIILLVSICSTLAYANTCKGLEKSAEQIMIDVLRANPRNSRPPANLEEVSSYCSNGKNGYATMKVFNKCLNGMPRQVFSILIRNIKKILKQYCESEEGQQDAFRHFSCFTPERFNKYTQCLKDYSVSLKYSTKAAQSDVIPATCCGFYKMEACMINVFKDKKGCPSDPNLDMVSFTKDFINKIFGDVFELMCGGLNNIDTCNRQAPEVVKNIDTYVQANSRSRNILYVRYLVQLSNKITN